MSTPESLQTLGWRPFFQAQVDVDGDTQPARVLHVHRGRVEVAHEAGHELLELSAKAREMGITVGDWVLIDRNGPRVRRRLDRFGSFQRRAAGAALHVGRRFFRTDIELLNFPLALVAGLVVAFLTIGYTTIRAATADPVRALRYE